MLELKELAGWALVGAAVTFAGMTLVRAGTINAAALPAAPPTERVSEPVQHADCPPPAPEDLASLESELAEIRARTTLLLTEAAAVEGQPLPWTDRLDAAVGEEAARAWLEPRAGQYEAEIESMDCSEYPCIAVLRGPPGEASIQDLPMNERFGGLTSTVMFADDTLWRVVSLGDSRLEGAEADRVRFRIDQVMSPD